MRRIATTLFSCLILAPDLSAKSEALPERVGGGIPMSDSIVELRLTLLQTTNAFGADFYRRFKAAEKSNDERELSDAVKMLRALCKNASESHTLGDVVIRTPMGRPFNYSYKSDAIKVRQNNEPLGWQLFGTLSPTQGRFISLSLSSRYFDGDMGDGIEMTSVEVSGTAIMSNGWPRILSRWSTPSRDIFLLGSFHRSPSDELFDPPRFQTWMDVDSFRKKRDERDLDKHFPPLLISDKSELMTRFSSELIADDSFDFVNGYSSSRSKSRSGNFLLMRATGLKRNPLSKPFHPWFLPKVGYPLKGTVRFAEPFGRHVLFPYTRIRRPGQGDINNHYLLFREMTPPSTQALILVENEGPYTGASFEVEFFEDSKLLPKPKLDETFLIQK